MAERQNKFLNQYKQRNKTATDDFVDKLYEEPEENAPTVTESAQAPVETQIKQDIIPDPVPVYEETNPSPEKPKRKAGRPRKTEEERSIFNIKLSVSEKELLNVASAAKGKSRVDYIVDLIKEDYAKNQEYYDTVRSFIAKN